HVVDAHQVDACEGSHYLPPFTTHPERASACSWVIPTPPPSSLQSVTFPVRSAGNASVSVFPSERIAVLVMTCCIPSIGGCTCQSTASPWKPVKRRTRRAVLLMCPPICR